MLTPHKLNYGIASHDAGNGIVRMGISDHVGNPLRRRSALMRRLRHISYK
jgi:hypothetical protein